MSGISQRLTVPRVVNVLALCLGVALLLSPRFVPPCGRQAQPVLGASVAMRCHWTFQIELLLAVSTVIVAGVLWIVGHPEARRVVGGVLVLFGLLAIAVTQSWVVGLCGNSAMACHHAAHWVWLWAILLAAVGVLIAVRAGIPARKLVVDDPWDGSGSGPRKPKEGA